MPERKKINVTESVAGWLLWIAMSILYKPEKNNRIKVRQQRVLKNLLKKACNTEFGKFHHFDTIINADYKDADLLYKKYKENVPVYHYGSIADRWWQPLLEGRQDLCWPGKIEFMGITSATSSGHNKQVPISRELIKNTRKVFKSFVHWIPNTGVPYGGLVKPFLNVVGSTTLIKTEHMSLGFFSGIMTANSPKWYQKICRPSPEVQALASFSEKREIIIRDAPGWDVGMITGFPVWIIALFEDIIAEYQLNNIHEIWPNLCMFQHGGMQIGPYMDRWEKVIGKPVVLANMYAATEGVIAFTKKAGGGLELVNTSGFFYEFLPVNETDFDASGIPAPDSNALSLWQVSPNVEYAILVTNCSGSWRYLIGDTIIFDNTTDFALRFAGRTAHFLNVCGEHVSMVQLDKALHFACEQSGSELFDFTVSAISNGKNWQYTWYLSDLFRAGDVEIARYIDEYICQINEDYRDFRNAGVLLPTLVIKVPDSRFIGYLQRPGKDNAQLKFPRVMKGQTEKEWREFVGFDEKNGSMSS